MQKIPATLAAILIAASSLVAQDLKLTSQAAQRLEGATGVVNFGDQFFVEGENVKQRPAAIVSAVTVASKAIFEVEDFVTHEDYEPTRPDAKTIIVTDPGKYVVRVIVADIINGELYFDTKKITVEVDQPLPSDSLKLTIEPSRTVEGTSATMTVTRSVATYDLQVSLSALPADRVSIPATANLVKGQLSTSVTVHAIDNIVQDDTVTVIIAADAICCDDPVTTSLVVEDNDSGPPPPVGCEAKPDDQFRNIGRFACQSLSLVTGTGGTEKDDVRRALESSADAIRNPDRSGIITMRDAFDHIRQEIDQAIAPKATDWAGWRTAVNEHIDDLDVAKAHVDDLCLAIAKGLE